MTGSSVLVALPNRDFDPTEAAIPWRVLRAAAHRVSFATPDGSPGAADPRTLTGEGLAPFRALLQARPDARAAYAEMCSSPEFLASSAFEAVEPGAYDALLLPGGHGPGMRPYLESERLFDIARAFVESGRPVAAVCHGVLVLARARGSDGASLLRGRRCTALTRAMEVLAYAMTRLSLGTHYLTYPGTTVEAEVVESGGLFSAGPLLPIHGTAERPDRGFVVRDDNLLSARFPGDAWKLGHALAEALS